MKKLLGRIIDPQFIIGILILIMWGFFLYKPLRWIDHIPISGSDLDSAREKYALLLDAATKISVLFTTALGFVFGHFFGKQGIESAEERALDEKVKAEKAEKITADTTGKIHTVKSDLQQRITKLEEMAARSQTHTTEVIAQIMAELRKS